MTEPVRIFEVGPRDGLQNQPVQVAAQDKIHLTNLLSACGFDRIEVTSFVSPKWVPQMADAAEVLAGITRNPAIRYSALTPNLRGFEGAVLAKADEVAVFASASEGFSQANINCSVTESLARFAPVLEAAKTANIPVRGYVSCVTDCPFDGPTDPAQVAWVAGQLRDMGCYEVSLGDTIGQGKPAAVDAMLNAVCATVPATQLAGHFHDTGGRALANVDVALAHGIRVFDAAIGGLGGCPYAPGAAGNLATETLAQHLHDAGIATRLDPAKLATAAVFARQITRGDNI